ncbi:hypothetical protein HFO71_24345 [Rhizobium laguerreae]|uniref:hypothetical protein n=1 Tax=Rhizobium laguerreae TaxID=1076926 RepID=UPI001C9212B8|nr:hypothetical protein [Rhizobium laguerreae]MBY3073448.1 hypothetical protein [Rhizobium laguerreae]
MRSKQLKDDPGNGRDGEAELCEPAAWKVQRSDGSWFNTDRDGASYWKSVGRAVRPESAADEIAALRARCEKADRRIAELEAALKPFNTGWADENGWTDMACQHDRIVDWFGPSDFRAIRALIPREE